MSPGSLSHIFIPLLIANIQASTSEKTPFKGAMEVVSLRHARVHKFIAPPARGRKCSSR